MSDIFKLKFESVFFYTFDKKYFTAAADLENKQTNKKTTEDVQIWNQQQPQEKRPWLIKHHWSHLRSPTSLQY